MVGNTIRTLRDGKNWTQADLAEKVGVQPMYIAHIERGRRFPKLPLIIKLADALQVPVAALVAQEDAAKVA